MCQKHAGSIPETKLRVKERKTSGLNLNHEDDLFLKGGAGWASPGSSVVVQVDPTGPAGGLGPDADHQGVEGDLGPVGPQVGAEGGAQGQRGVRVELAEVEVPAELWRSRGTTTQGESR